MENNKIIVFSFGHLIPREVKDQFLREHPRAEFFEYSSHFYFNESLVPQVERMVERAVRESGLGAGIPYVILPGVSVASALMICFFHGLTGLFPLIIEMSRDPGQRSQFRLKEIHDLDYIRNQTRNKRFRKEDSSK